MAEQKFPPYNVGDLAAGQRREAPAAARNVGPIGDVLADWLPTAGMVLELASGTGEHALAFARRFPTLAWQPSDRDPAALASIAAWRSEGPDNLLAPAALDTCVREWPVAHADALVSINMVHIAPWPAALGLLDGAARLLPVGGPLILYGPWLEEDRPAAASNLAFDRDLKTRDARWGLRHVSHVAAEAAARSLVFAERREMPANNIMLRFVRD